MILLERKRPEKLDWLEAAIRRLPTDHPSNPQFAEQYRRIVAGLAGERRVDREWDEIIFPNTFYILHDISFQCSLEHTYQIDTLFICSHFLLILEIKNIVGRIDFDEYTHQFTRTKADGTIEGFTSAIDQVQRHARFLKTILKKLNLPLPIECAIVFANSNSIINNKQTTTPLFHVTGLQQKLNHFFKHHPTPSVDEGLLKRQVMKIKEMHSPRPHNYTAIDQQLIKHGVLCPTCNYHFQMHFLRGYWYCPNCKCKSIEVFAESLNDYRLLISNRITNRELRAFFGIDSIHAATRILLKYQFESSGSFKNRVYYLPDNLLEHMHKFFEC